VKIVASAPAGSHDPIVYPAVVIKSSKQPDVARKLLDYLLSDKAAAILREKGFSDQLRSSKTPSP
jgi:molybdate transport system substrate-binding protein